MTGSRHAKISMSRRQKYLVAGGLTILVLTTWVGWSWLAAPLIVCGGLILVALSCTRPGHDQRNSEKHSRLLQTLDESLDQIASETRRATSLSCDAVNEIMRHFRKWEETYRGDDGVRRDATENAACEIIRLLQFEDISGQALEAAREGISECRHVVRAMADSRCRPEDLEARLKRWQHGRQSDRQRDMRAGSVDLF